MKNLIYLQQHRMGSTRDMYFKKLLEFLAIFWKIPC